jgi:hypothetical protein
VYRLATLRRRLERFRPAAECEPHDPLRGPAAVLKDGERGEVEAGIACAFVADAGYELATPTLWCEDVWGIEAGALDAAAGFVRAYRSPDYVSELCGSRSTSR